MEDLVQIARYSEKTWGRAQRVSYLRQLDLLFHALADNPSLGRPCDDVRPGYFKHPEGSHIVYYRLGASGAVEIIRVLHKRMDVGRFF